MRNTTKNNIKLCIAMFIATFVVFPLIIIAFISGSHALSYGYSSNSFWTLEILLYISVVATAMLLRQKTDNSQQTHF